MSTASPAPLDLSALGSQMGQLVKTAAASYVQGHTADVQALGSSFGKDLLNAIFSTTVLSQLPPIQPLDTDADAAHIALVEETLEARDEQLALIASAELKDAQTVAKLKADAVGVAGGLVNSMIGLVGGLALKAVSAGTL